MCQQLFTAVRSATGRVDDVVAGALDGIQDGVPRHRFVQAAGAKHIVFLLQTQVFLNREIGKLLAYKFFVVFGPRDGDLGLA